MKKHYTKICFLPHLPIFLLHLFRCMRFFWIFWVQSIKDLDSFPAITCDVLHEERFDVSSDRSCFQHCRSIPLPRVGNDTVCMLQKNEMQWRDQLYFPFFHLKDFGINNRSKNDIVRILLLQFGCYTLSLYTMGIAINDDWSEEDN